MSRQFATFTKAFLLVGAVLFLAITPLLLQSSGRLDGTGIVLLWPFDTTLQHYNLLKNNDIQIISEGYSGVYLVKPPENLSTPSIHKGFILLPSVLGLGCDFSMIDEAATRNR